MPIRARDEDFFNTSASNNAKKQRLAFGKGSVVYLRAENFMTYGLAEFTPGPRLNLVLGPNGSGKSSFVSAICLGLAGSPKLLGRADNLRDFVLRGKDSGHVEIHLSNGDGTITRIKRSINKSANTSTWKINGQEKLLRDVIDVVEDMGIQLDNLVQFMPQDKVADFARLRPRELLEETERAIGDASLYRLHHELIEERKEFVSLELTAKSGKDDLNRLEKINESLRRDVSRFEHKAELESQIKDLEGRVAWLDYNAQKIECESHNVILKKAESSLKALESDRKQGSAPQKEKEKRMNVAEKRAKKAKDFIGKAMKDIQIAESEIADLTENLDEKQQEIQDAEGNYKRQQADIAKLQGNVEKAEKALEEFDANSADNPAPDHTAEIKRLVMESKDATQNVRSFNTKREDLRTESSNQQHDIDQRQQRLKAFTDIREKKLTSLETYSKDIRKFVNWLNLPETRSSFKGAVYGPLLTEIEIKDALHAQFLEQHCPNNLWSRFIVLEVEDQKTLVNMSEGSKHPWDGHFKPIVTHYGGNTSQPVTHPEGDASKYAAEHITHTLDELFECNHAVKLAICQETNLNAAYCGTEALDANRFLESHPRILKVLTPEASYQVRVSRYNTAARSTAYNALKPSKILMPSNSAQDDHERNEVQRQINESTRAIEKVKRELVIVEREIKEEARREAEIKAKLSGLQAEMNAAKSRRSTLVRDIQTAKKAHENKLKLGDPRDEIPEIRNQIEVLKQNLSVKMEEIVASYTELLGFHKDHAVNAATQKELAGQIETLNKARTASEDRLKRMRLSVTEIKEGIKNAAKDLVHKKGIAEAITGEWTEELAEKLSQLPDSHQEILTTISEKQSEIDAIHVANPQAHAEYTQRMKDIVDLQMRIKEQDGTLDKSRKALETKIALWLPELKATVQQINLKFQDCFRKIGCAGEVLLHEEESPTSILPDFEKFAIHIRVRYRNGENMQLLDQHRQSGGERSVATILYLNSLQNVTVCPFRVVDEINQGMDPLNERKCFMQLVDAACQPNTPQCFLLTPKLLPNLPYSEHITLMQIFNGATIKEAAKDFQKAHLIGRRPIVAAC